MLTIIHLSDLHLHQGKNEPDNRNARKLVNHLKDRFNGYEKVNTYVVITGDLVDDALLKQYKNLSSTVLEPLAQQFTILAVPGNHDYALAGNLFDRNGPGRYVEYVLPVIKVVLPGFSWVVFGVRTGIRGGCPCATHSFTNRSWGFRRRGR